jgi:hypothetical protein
MARNKAEKELARAKRKKEARKREEARRSAARGTRDAIHSLLSGSATATDLARVFNNGLSSTPHSADDEQLDAQLSELRIEVDIYLEAMSSAMQGSYRRENLFPGVLFGLVPGEATPAELEEADILCEPMPLALACRGNLTFEPIDDHFQKNPDTSAATWVVSTNFNPILGGMLVLALSGNREGARTIHVIREGKWARLNGFFHVDRFFLKTMKELVEENHPDAILLATAVRLDSASRESRSLEEAVAEVERTPEDELWQRVKPYLGKLRFSQFAYHSDLMALVHVIAGIRESWDQDVRCLKEKARAMEDLAEAQRKRAGAAENALAHAQRASKGHEVRQAPLPAAATSAPVPAFQAGPPLRDRLAELFK